MLPGVHNLAIQGIFDRSTIDTGATRWITTEFGFGLVVVSVLIALYFWSRRGEPLLFFCSRSCDPLLHEQARG